MHVITHMPDGCQLDVIHVMVRSSGSSPASGLVIALRSENWAGILQCRQKCFLRKPDRGREFFLHAYAFAVITEDKVAEQAISDDMKRHLGITPSLQLVSHEAD